jgi:hypothetical protein
MRKILSALFLALLVGSTAQGSIIITQWDFEGDVITPSTGDGTASLIGGTTSTFATGSGGGRGWNTTNYPAQSVGSGTAGVSFLVDTTGYKKLRMDFDHRASGTASRWAQLDYTLDGGSSWVTGFWNNGGDLSPHDNFYSFSIDLGSLAGASNNPDFGVRIVSIFSPLAFSQNASLSYGADEAYMRANLQAVFSGTGVGSGNYGAGGTWRFDNVTFTGVPEPSAFLLTSFVLGTTLIGRRRRS